MHTYPLILCWILVKPSIPFDIEWNIRFLSPQVIHSKLLNCWNFKIGSWGFFYLYLYHDQCPPLSFCSCFLHKVWGDPFLHLKYVLQSFICCCHFWLKNDMNLKDVVPSFAGNTSKHKKEKISPLVFYKQHLLRIQRSRRQEKRNRPATF